MEASALRAPAGLGRLPLGAPLLRLRSDDQLVALFRAGSDEAFRVLHDRYRQRLFAYVRQMLSVHSRQDAEDVLQDVFVRAFGALRGDTRDVCVRAWLYRVAHNRCIDHLRRPDAAGRRDLRDVAQAAARPGRGGAAARRPQAARGRRRPPARAAALRDPHARDRRAELRRPGLRAGRHRARRQVAARAGAGGAGGGPGGARRLLRGDPARPARLLRPRREGLRPRAPPPARVRRLPPVPRRAARRPPLVRGARARRVPRPRARGQAPRAGRERRGRRRRGRRGRQRRRRWAVRARPARSRPSCARRPSAPAARPSRCSGSPTHERAKEPARARARPRRREAAAVRERRGGARRPLRPRRAGVPAQRARRPAARAAAPGAGEAPRRRRHRRPPGRPRRCR